MSSFLASTDAIMPSKLCFTHSQDNPARLQISLPRSISKPEKVPFASVWLPGG